MWQRWLRFVVDWAICRVGAAAFARRASTECNLHSQVCGCLGVSVLSHLLAQTPKRVQFALGPGLAPLHSGGQKVLFAR